MSLSQNDMGRAFEYALAMSLSNLLPAPIVENLRSLKAQACFAIASQTERQNMKTASKEAVMFLIAHDVRLSESSCSISLQSDQEGIPPMPSS